MIFDPSLHEGVVRGGRGCSATIFPLRSSSQMSRPREGEVQMSIRIFIRKYSSANYFGYSSNLATNFLLEYRPPRASPPPRGLMAHVIPPASIDVDLGMPCNRNRGAIAAGRSPWSVIIVSSVLGILFFNQNLGAPSQADFTS